MSKVKYFELVEAFCLASDATQPQSIIESGVLRVNEIDFSLTHNEQVDDALLFIYADFGALPQGQELAATAALLEANLFLYSDSAPVFAISPETGRVVMAQHRRLPALDVDGLTDTLVDMAAKAKQWRICHYLDAYSKPFQIKY